MSTTLTFELFEVGSYNDSGFEHPASRRGSGVPSVDNYDNVGFRVTLYLL